MTAPDDLKITRMILDAQCYVIANLKSVTAQQIADLVRRVIKLLISQNGASCRIDDGRFVWIQCCIMTWKHGGNGSPCCRLAS